MDAFHAQLLDEIDLLKKEKFKLEQQIRQFDKVKLAYESEIRGLEAELDDLNNEVEIAQDLNTNLKRICRERANADRGLKPKKQHNGYVALATSSYLERYRTSDREMKEFLAFRTVIQTPYSVKFTMKSVEDMLYDDGYICFKRFFGDGWSSIPMGTNANSKSQKLENQEKNYIFRWNLKASLQKTFWEIEVCHTKPLTVPLGE